MAATGLSSTESTTTRPCLATSSRKCRAPSTNTLAPAGTSRATMRAATTEEVMTCHGSTSKSNPLSWSATTDCSLDELLVVYSTVMPRRSALRMFAAACSTGFLPRYTTPSRSSNASLYASLRGRFVDFSM